MMSLKNLHIIIDRKIYFINEKSAHKGSFVRLYWACINYRNSMGRNETGFIHTHTSIKLYIKLIAFTSKYFMLLCYSMSILWKYYNNMIFNNMINWIAECKQKAGWKLNNHKA